MYSQKKYAEAIKVFSEGIELYQKDSSQATKSESMKLKVTQLYTNRALSYHMIND